MTALHDRQEAKSVVLPVTEERVGAVHASWPPHHCFIALPGAARRLPEKSGLNSLSDITTGNTTMIKALWNDEAGVILSAEIVLVGTILVVGMIVGLVELQCSVVDELNDLGEAIGSVNQSYITSSMLSLKANGQIKAATNGSLFLDRQDSCDGNECAIVCITGAIPELPK